MASNRKNYFKNYKLEQIPNHSRKGYKNVYKYIGDYYAWDIPAVSLNAYKLFFGISELFAIICFITSSIQNISLNKEIYVVIPSLISLCTLVFEIVAIGIFCFVKFPLREDDYSRIDSTLFFTLFSRVICLTPVSVLCLIDTVRMSLGIKGFLVTSGYTLCVITTIIMKLQYRRLTKKKKVILSFNN